MPFRRPGRSTWYVQFATPRGIVRRSAGTRERDEAAAIENALRALRAIGAHDLLEAAGDGRLPLVDLVGSRRDVERLRERTAELDLRPLVGRFAETVAERVSPGTARRYRRAVESLVRPERPFPRSALTSDAVAKWLDAHPGRPATRRAAHAALSRFADFLVERRVLPRNPVRAVRPPGAPAPRCRWIDAATMTRLAEAQPAPFCALSALLGGTGLELAAALRLTPGDVDLERREVRAPGRRGGVDRVARVADWAWRHVARHCRGASDERLFPGIDRRAAARAHRTACDSEGLVDYRVSDQRHSWAVRAVRAGTPVELVARQLGLAGPARVVEVYGAFAPARAERDRWEHLATAQDAERAATEKVALGHALYHPVYQPRVTDHLKSDKQASDKSLSESWSARRSRFPGTGGGEETLPRSPGG